MTLTVACINHRNYLGRGAEYVAKLRAAVARQLSVPHTFCALTEAELGEDLTGWWVKMKLFEPGRFAGPVLYFDLDVILTAPIDALLAWVDGTHLWMRDDFSYSIVHPKPGIGAHTRQQLGGPGCCNSSVMYWHGAAMGDVWHCWEENATLLMRELHGDQNAITQIGWPHRIGLLPASMIQSYKYDIRMGGQRPAPVVVTHGEPKPHQLREPWVEEHWRL